jgi:hypothetical protein
MPGLLLKADEVPVYLRKCGWLHPMSLKEVSLPANSKGAGQSRRPCMTDGLDQVLDLT